MSFKGFRRRQTGFMKEKSFCAMCETSESFEFWKEFWNLSSFLSNSYPTCSKKSSIDDNRFKMVRDFYDISSEVYDSCQKRFNKLPYFRSVCTCINFPKAWCLKTDITIKPIIQANSFFYSSKIHRNITAHTTRKLDVCTKYVFTIAMTKTFQHWQNSMELLLT